MMAYAQKELQCGDSDLHIETTLVLFLNISPADPSSFVLYQSRK